MSGSTSAHSRPPTPVASLGKATEVMPCSSMMRRNSFRACVTLWAVALPGWAWLSGAGSCVIRLMMTRSGPAQSQAWPALGFS